MKIRTCRVLGNRREFDSDFLLKKVFWEEVLLTCEHHIVLEPEGVALLGDDAGGGGGDGVEGGAPARRVRRRRVLRDDEPDLVVGGRRRRRLLGRLRVVGRRRLARHMTQQRVLGVLPPESSTGHNLNLDVSTHTHALSHTHCCHEYST